MEKYIVTKPIRLVQVEDKRYLLSVPAELAKIDVDDYVMGFLNLIREKDYLKVSEFEDFISNMSNKNKEQYLIVFRKLIDEKILVPLE